MIFRVQLLFKTEDDGLDVLHVEFFNTKRYAESYIRKVERDRPDIIIRKTAFKEVCWE